MGSFQPCGDSSDAIELKSSLGLYLKPIAKMNISVQLPQLRNPVKSISNWEVMEKIKEVAKPHNFIVLKVIKSTLEFIRFEAEAENKSSMKAILTKLESKCIKLSGFCESLKLKAAEAKISFPTRHDWDSHFRDAKNSNEMEPGERPDTIHFQGLPSRWFTDPKKKGKSSKDDERPSEWVLKWVCENFGEVCNIDIPMLDPYRRENHLKSVSSAIPTFSFGQDLTFEAFVQYKEYIGFVNAMDVFRGMKLMYTNEDGKSFTASVKIDFDKTKHLSCKNIAKRKRDREKLQELEREREERVIREREAEERRKEEEIKKKKAEELEHERRKRERMIKQEERYRLREQKRKRRKLEKRQKEELAKQEKAIALEERKILLTKRKLDSIRLLGHLFSRAEEIKVKDDLKKRERELEHERIRELTQMQEQLKVEQLKKDIADQQMRQKLLDQEENLKWKLLDKMKQRKEKRKEEQREQLRKKLAAKRSKLKSVLVVGTS